MLVITRRVGERIRIGDDVVVQVMEVTGNGVRLGIDAPRSTRIYREELWIAVQEENRLAAEAAPADLPKAPQAAGPTTS